MTIIQSKDHFLELLSLDRFVMVPVLEHPKLHYKENTLSFIYGIGSTSKKEFLYNHNHYDYPKLGLDLGDLRGISKHIIFNKKYLPFFPLVSEGNLILWMNGKKTIHTFLDSSLDASVIPICRWIDKIRSHLVDISEILPIIEKDYFGRYDDIINQLIKVENAGLYTSSPAVSADTSTPRIEYTEYYPYTSTGRPSNRYGGTNFAALNKTDGSRKKYISRFQMGSLVEYDYEAYHIHLISKLIGYSFNENPYLSLARNIFNIENPTGEDIGNVKNLVFSQVYGGIRHEYLNIDFFRKLDDFLKRMNDQYRKNQLQTFLFRKPIERQESLIKTFNYLLQNLETEINSLILKKIHDFLVDKESKCILYTYDSFLFDVNHNEKEIIYRLRDIIESIGVPCRIKQGNNYGDMTLL